MAGEEYVVEKILEKRVRGGKAEYLVCWEGYPDEADRTWEPAKHLKDNVVFAAWQKENKSGPDKDVDENMAAELDVETAGEDEAHGAVQSDATGADADAGDAELEEHDGSDNDEDGDNDNNDDDYDGDDWSPPKKTKQKATPSKVVAMKAPSKTPKTSTKRARDTVLPADAPLNEFNMVAHLQTWDLPTLKSFVAAMVKETNSGHHSWRAPLDGLKAGNKSQTLEDVIVTVRSVYAGFGVRYVSSYGNRDETPALFSSERIETSREKVVSSSSLLAAVEKAFTRVLDSVSAKRSRACMRPEAKALLPRLSVLDHAQLTQLVCSLVSDDLVSEVAVVERLPKADLEPMLAELEKLVRAISRALPNSRFGSCTGQFGYKRCASAVCTAKRKFKEGIKQFRGAKEWAAASEFATRALRIAANMVVFDSPTNNSHRAEVIESLNALRNAAALKLQQACVD